MDITMVCLSPQPIQGNVAIMSVTIDPPVAFGTVGNLAVVSVEPDLPVNQTCGVTGIGFAPAPYIVPTFLWRGSGTYRMFALLTTVDTSSGQQTKTQSDPITITGA